MLKMCPQCTSWSLNVDITIEHDVFDTIHRIPEWWLTARQARAGETEDDSLMAWAAHCEALSASRRES